MDDPNTSGTAALPDDLAETPSGADVDQVAHWHDGFGWRQMRPRIGGILTYICVVDGCDYQLSQTTTE